MSIFHEKPRTTFVRVDGRFVRLDSYHGTRPGMTALYRLTRFLADEWTTIALLLLIAAISAGGWGVLCWMTGVEP